MWAPDLILIARKLVTGVVGSGKGRPREAELRRAVSTAYYALFHTLARSGADLLVGRTKKFRSQLAWQQAYRALDHEETRKRCLNTQRMAGFPSAIQVFADTFVAFQQLRHLADYDPLAKFSRSMVLQWVDEVDNAISGFNSVERSHRKASAAYVLFKRRSERPSRLD